MKEKPILPECLQTSLSLRCPVFRRDRSPREKIDDLESYLLLSAFTQGELTHERMNWLVEKVPLEWEWDHMGGWQELRTSRTLTGIQHAKRLVRPDLYDQMQAIDWMVKRLTEEIDRMERDASKCSRAYTMLVGT